MRKLFILAATILFSLSVPAQQQSQYAKQWEEIDSLIVLKDLPKSALVKVNVIYADAKSKHLQDEVIKTLLYRSRTRRFRNDRTGCIPGYNSIHDTKRHLCYQWR